MAIHGAVFLARLQLSRSACMRACSRRLCPLSEGRKRRAIRESPLRLDRQTLICHPERSEGSPIAQNKPARNEILRLSAQNDKRAGEHSSHLQPQGTVVPFRKPPRLRGRLPHSVREMSRSDRGRPPPSAGGARKACGGGANYIKIRGRAWKPAPTNGAPSRRPLRTKWNFHGRAG